MLNNVFEWFALTAKQGFRQMYPKIHVNRPGSMRFDWNTHNVTTKKTTQRSEKRNPSLLSSNDFAPEATTCKNN